MGKKPQNIVNMNIIGVQPTSILTSTCPWTSIHSPTRECLEFCCCLLDQLKFRESIMAISQASAWTCSDQYLNGLSFSCVRDIHLFTTTNRQSPWWSHGERWTEHALLVGLFASASAQLQRLRTSSPAYGGKPGILLLLMQLQSAKNVFYFHTNMRCGFWRSI
jgi:hypothetical protein